MSNLQAARTAIDELTQALGWLTANLLPGTHKPWTPPALGAEEQAERRFYQDMHDRHFSRLSEVGRHVILPLGESPAPFDLDVADLLSEILVTADRLCDLVCDDVDAQALEQHMREMPARPDADPDDWATTTPRTPRPPAAMSAFADPGPYLTRAQQLLPLASHTTLAAIERACDTVKYRAHTLLGLIGDGQLLNATCPWCDGRTTSTPTGGAKTLRVRAQLPPGKTHANVDASDVDWFIVCEGDCDPPSKDCGTWLRGHPAWSLKNEGAWLAQRIEKAAS